jgi:hypothetical protein
LNKFSNWYNLRVYVPTVVLVHLCYIMVKCFYYHLCVLCYHLCNLSFCYQITSSFIYININIFPPF